MRINVMHHYSFAYYLLYYMITGPSCFACLTAAVRRQLLRKKLALVITSYIDKETLFTLYMPPWLACKYLYSAYRYITKNRLSLVFTHGIYVQWMWGGSVWGWAEELLKSAWVLWLLWCCTSFLCMCASLAK